MSARKIRYHRTPKTLQTLKEVAKSVCVDGFKVPFRGRIKNIPHSRDGLPKSRKCHVYMHCTGTWVPGFDSLEKIKRLTARRINRKLAV